MSGAGDDRVNGRFVPVDSLPPKGVSVGPLTWRKEDSDWLHLMNSEGCWWIGHYANCTEDLYSTMSAPKGESAISDVNNYMNPPVNLQAGCWRPCLERDPKTGKRFGTWFKGKGPPPELRWDDSQEGEFRPVD